MKILIVEDEQELLQSMVSFLKGSGMTCEQATNLNEAVEKVEMYDYDCIVLDIGLPDGSGLKLIEELQKKDHQTGVVIVSARN
jgi:DNA-binding response OmpR family regulator